MYNVVVLGLTSFFTDVASEMAYPLVPFFLTTTLGASPAILGLIEGTAESIASLLRVFSGYLSDRLKARKALAILGYTFSMFGKLFLYLARSWGVVVAGRVVDRVGKGIRTAPRDALIADSVGGHSRGKAYGLHRSLDTAGAAIGVLLAYWILLGQVGAYTSVFLWSLIPAAVGVALLFLVREARPATAAAARLPTLRWDVLPRKLRLFLLVTLVFSLGNSSNTFLLLRAGEYEGAPSTVLLMYLVYNMVYGLLSFPAGRLSDSVGRKTLLVAGYGAYGAVYAGFALLHGESRPWLPWMLFASYGIYSALTEGVEKALISDLAPQEVRATAIGWHATIVGVGLFPASLIAGQLWTLAGASAPFWFGGGMGMLAMIGLLLVL